MLARDTLDDALEQHRVVGGLERVGVQQVDLELADAVLGDRCVGRHALSLALVVDVTEEGAEVLEFIERQQRVGIETFAGIGRDRRAGGLFVRVDEVEFEFGGAHRLEPQFGIAADDCRQRLARIGKKRGDAVAEQPERNHGARAGGPVDRHGAPARGVADAVGVAGGEDHGIAHDVLAPYIHADDRQGHADAAFRHTVRLFDGNPLAAQDAVEVDHTSVKNFDLGVPVQPADDVAKVRCVGVHIWPHSGRHFIEYLAETMPRG